MNKEFRIMNLREREIKKIQRFTDLVVWQEGHKLVLIIYQETKKFPSEEKYGLVSQMQRAAVSFTSNIAEGFSRRSPKEKYQAYSIAKASITELQNQLLIARDIGFLSRESFNKIAQHSVIADRLITGLLKSTRQRKYES